MFSNFIKWISNKLTVESAVDNQLTVESAVDNQLTVESAVDNQLIEDLDAPRVDQTLESLKTNYKQLIEEYRELDAKRLNLTREDLEAE